MLLPLRLISGPLRLFFKLLYHQMAWTYDGVAYIVSLGMWQEWVLSVLPFLPGPDVLEIGHGPGHLQTALWAQGIFVAGLDESWQMSKMASLRLQEVGNKPNLVNGYAQFIPFAANSFHQVVATFPSEYIYDPQTLEEIHRVLVPGGSLIVLPLAWITGDRPLNRLAAWTFRFTGQAPDWEERSLKPFSSAGFKAHAEIVNLSSSILLHIIAEKPLNGRP